jgi:outer membrane protein insertion porin family
VLPFRRSGRGCYVPRVLTRASLAVALSVIVGWAHPAVASVDDAGAGPPTGVDVFDASGDDGFTGAIAQPANRPTLVRIEFPGRVYFKDETLQTFVQSQLDAPVDEAMLQDDATTIADQYRARGYLRATVDVEVVPVEAIATPGARAAVARFVIRAGERAELKAVHVVGNARVDEASLKDGFFSRPPEPLGALTRAGLFHRPYLEQDQQRIVFNYYKRGFLEARVLDTRVTASSDLSGIEVTLSVQEGAQYRLASLTFTGDLPEGETSSSWRARVPLADGGVADLVTLNQQTDPLLDAWREKGFPFARFEQQLDAAPAPEGDAATKGIAVVLNVVKGPEAVVREVRIVGNKGTLEHVFRRELVVRAGERYDHRAVRLSERQLMQTGLLMSAQGRALPVPAAAAATGEPPVPSLPEGGAAVDVEFTVAETTTWLLSPAMFGDANEGLIFIGVAGDRNLLGTGLQAFSSVQWSALRFLFDVSLTEPRVLGTRSSATIEAHRRELRYRDFTTSSLFGTSVRANYAYDLGFRMGGPARWFAGGGVGVEYGGVVSLDDKPLKPSSLLPQDTFRNVIEARAGFDTREGGLSPRNGMLVAVETSTAGPWTASGVTFVDGQANVRLFWSPLWDITLKSNTQAGAIMNPLGGDAPVTDRYFLGGLGSIRGFFPRSIGPAINAPLRDGSVVAVDAGGTVEFIQNVEIEAPVWPGWPLRAFGFVDAGNAFGDEELARGLVDVERGTAALPLNLLWSTGFGVLLETPVLPFRFEWSVPLTRRSYDQPLNFFLGVGSAF